MRRTPASLTFRACAPIDGCEARSWSARSSSRANAFGAFVRLATHHWAAATMALAALLTMRTENEPLTIGESAPKRATRLSSRLDRLPR